MKQKGCICIDGKNWAVRWRETVSDRFGARKNILRFKILGPVTQEHRCNKDRDGKIAVPIEIRSITEGFMLAVNGYISGEEAEWNKRYRENEKQRKEEQCVKQGKKLMTEVRAYLRNLEA